MTEDPRSIRRKWIAKFAERQRATRRWLSIPEIVEWCSQSTTAASIEEEEKARELAYRRISDSILKGDFEIGGKSKILYLDSFVSGDGKSPRCRLTREQFKIAWDAVAIPPASSLPFPVLNRCWLPRQLARSWMEAHGYRWGPHFDPSSETRSSVAIPISGSPGATVTDPQSTKPMTLPSGIQIIRAVDAEGACRDWIANLNERPANKDEAFAEARAAVAGIGPLSRKAFDRAWAAAAPVQWQSAGRRRKPR